MESGIMNVKHEISLKNLPYSIHTQCIYSAYFFIQRLAAKLGKQKNK